MTAVGHSHGASGVGMLKNGHTDNSRKNIILMTNAGLKQLALAHMLLDKIYQEDICCCLAASYEHNLAV